MINVGLVGFGFAGRVFHAPIISAVPGLKLRAILQRSGDDAAKIYPRTAVVRSLDELLSIDEIKLVVIATPNTLHYPFAKASLEAGRNVVVDKPFTTTYTEAEELIGIARKRELLLTVYQNLRSNGDFRTIRQLAETGRFGRVATYEAHFDRYRLERRPEAWRERPEPGSGVFFDLGVHLIDQAMVLFGIPEAITADIRIERDGAAVDDAFDVMLHYPKTRALLRASMIALAPDLRFVVRGERAAFVKYGIDPQEETLKRGQVPADDNWGREPKEKWGILTASLKGTIQCEKVPTLPGDYRLFYANVHESLTAGSAPDVTSSQMLAVMRALELAKESSDQGRTVKWR